MIQGRKCLQTESWMIASNRSFQHRLGRRVIITGNQIRQLARRGRNHISMRNRPVILVEEPTLYGESYKRLYSGQLAEEARRMAMYRETAMAHGDNDIYLDCTDDPANLDLVQASNGGNLYGGFGTSGTSKMISNDGASNGWNGTGNPGTDSPDRAYEGLDPAVILAKQGWEIYGIDGNFGRATCDNNRREIRGNGKNGGARRLLTLGNVSIVDSDSD